MNFFALILIFLTSFLVIQPIVAENADYHVRDSRTYMVLKSRVDSKHYLVIEPGMGVFEVELLKHDIKTGIIFVRFIKALGRKIDVNNDGKKEREELLGKTLKIEQSKPAPIMEINQTYAKQKRGK